MKTSSLFLVAGAIVLAASSALVARALMRPPPPVTIVKEVEVKPPPTKQILIATHDIQPGEFLNGSDMKWQDIPAESVHAGFLEKDSMSDRQIYGTTIKRPLDKNAAFLQDNLVRPGDPGFLSAVLRPGMRAISVPTSAVASNAGLVSAGDQVDVILSLQRNEIVTSSEPSQPPPLAAQTILRNVRVLALDNSVASIAPAQVTDDKDKNAKASARLHYDTITLEVEPRDAEKLAVAKELGTLHVALRSTNEDDTYNPAPTHTSVTRLTDTTDIFTNKSGKASKPPRVQIYKGSQAAVVETSF